MYVADVLSATPADHRILVFAHDGTLRSELGKGQLNYPNAIVVGSQGEIYVSDSNNGRVVVIDDSGTVTTLIARGVGDGDLGLPRGLAIDDQGRLFVVDTTDHMVRQFTPAASPTAHPAYVGSFGDEGHDDGKFTFPNGWPRTPVVGSTSPTGRTTASRCGGTDDWVTGPTRVA